MRLKIFKQYLLDGVIILFGCFLIGSSFSLFFDPNGIAPGGATGLFVVLNKWLHVETWLLNLLFNIPLYILAFKVLSHEACIKTLLGILLCSVAFKLTAFLSQYHITDDTMLACISGAVLLGAGTGIIFRVGGSTGGTGLIALLLNHYFPKVSTPKLMGVADGIIVLLSGISDHKIETALYSAVALYLLVLISDKIVAKSTAEETN